MKFNVNISTSLEEIEDGTYDTLPFYYTQRTLNGISVSQNNDFCCVGNFSLEQLKANDERVFVPYIGYSKEEDDGFYKNYLVEYLGVFLTEEKAQNAKKIVELVCKLDQFILKNGLNDSETKELFKDVKTEVTKLGGGWKQVKNEISAIIFLDENDEDVILEKPYNFSIWLSESKVYEGKVLPENKITKKSKKSF